jgi:putative inorganic carbon (HCO3(-)) transporter
MYEIIIEFGIIFLLIYTPLAFGGVSQRSITLLEIVSSLLFIAWLAKIISQRRKRGERETRRRGDGETERRRERKRGVGEVLPISPSPHLPLMVAFLVFFALILLQLIPLPSFLVNLVSPATYRLYVEGTLHTSSELPNLLPLSVCSQATETELYKFLAYAIIFFLIVNTIRTRKQINRLLYAIIVVGFLVSLYGLIQFVSGQHFIYSHKMKSFWVHGTFVNKNHFAGYIEMVILLTFGMLFTRFEKRGSSPLRKIEQTFEEKYMKGFFALFVLFIMVAAHLLSGSRGGIISFSLGMIFFILLVYTRRLLRNWIVIVLIFLPVVAVMMMMIVPEEFIASLTRFTEQQFEPSFRVRWEIWRTLGHIFQDFPILGSGFGTFSHLARRYQTFRWFYRLAHSESDFMQLLAETGIVGMVLVAWMGGMFFYYILSAWKRQRSRWAVAIIAGGLSAIVSLVIHGGVDFNLHIPSNALLFSVIAALSYVTAHTRRTEGKKGRSQQSAVGSQQSPVTSHQSPVTSHQSAVGSQQSPVTSCQSPVNSRQVMSHVGVFVFVFVLVVLYLFCVGNSYYAFVHYQDVSEMISQENLASVDAAEHGHIISRLKTAIRHDRNHAEYAYALGSYLYRCSVDTQNSEAIAHKEQGFREAEGWLRKAIMLDPANPWYYYEMGLLSYDRGDCNDWENTHPTDSWKECLVTRYFLAALDNAPKNSFLRKEVGRWYYSSDPEATVQLMREIISGDMDDTLVTAAIAHKFSEFLYEIRMDYESDREAKRALDSEKGKSEECEVSVASRSKINFALQEEAEEQMLRKADVKKGRRIELGNDDGSAEWRTALTSETQRIKKVICLPENLDEYNYAALKILMNSSDNRNFTTHISVDEQLVRRYHHALPSVRNWHEIPFDISRLQGKSRINVYIRVTGASKAGNYLEIWGDQDTPNMQSVLNFNTKDDLSLDEGIQTGEYMIRLVLKKS